MPSKPIRWPETHVQSALAGWETCPRRTRFALQAPDDLAIGWVGSAGDLGTVFHSVAAEMLRTMWKYDHQKMPTQEAIEISREVYAAGDIVLPTADRHTLRQLVLGFCQIPFEPKRIMVLEQMLSLDIVCTDGVTRTLKGTPDLIMADPPNGLLVLDWKTGKGRPSAPQGTNPEPGEVVEGKAYLSDRGLFQLDTYGLLALKGRLDDGSMLSPGARRVTLRELHLRSGQVREASLSLDSDDLEHVETDIRDHLMMLDRAISEGPKSLLWRPRPGSHCLKKCPVSRSCPIPREQRGIGALSTQVQADREAEIAAAWEAKRAQSIDRLKEWEMQGNPPGQPNDREAWRWGPERDAWRVKGGGRSFKIWPALNGNGNEEG